MAKTIVLSNQKGGVGKTTTANALALIFRERGYKVLAVDLDPQGNLKMCIRDRDSPFFRDRISMIPHHLSNRKSAGGSGNPDRESPAFPDWFYGL